MAEIQGTYGPAFQKLIDLFQEKLSEGEELGGAINININGEDTVNVWAGYTDKDKTTLWAADTITNVYSSTKTVAAIAVLVAHERGLLSVDDPVANLWPELREGKDPYSTCYVPQLRSFRLGRSHNNGGGM